MATTLNGAGPDRELSFIGAPSPRATRTQEGLAVVYGSSPAPSASRGSAFVPSNAGHPYAEEGASFSRSLPVSSASVGSTSTCL